MSTFLPNIVHAYSLIKTTKLDPTLVQVLIGHGFGQYLHRFKCKASPSYVRDPDEEESILRLILECPTNATKRCNVETTLNKTLAKVTMWEGLSCKNSDKFIEYCKKVGHEAICRNK